MSRLRAKIKGVRYKLVSKSAEVVELADTPSRTADLDLPRNLLTEKQIAYGLLTYALA